jgi:glycosyltransferase involved in cell wall biosynthesis
VLFTAGSIRPARGLEDLLHALEALAARDRRPTLWIAGTVAGAANRYYEALRLSIADRGLANQVRWLGGLSRREMSWCFGNCDLFVMTSRVEACPNTALEAMSHGVLSASTRNRPMPEMFAGSADFYPAGNGMLLAESIARMLSLSVAERARRSATARQRAAEYSWERAAEGTVRELRLAWRSGK